MPELVLSPLRLENVRISADEIAEHFRVPGSLSFVMACRGSVAEIEARLQPILAGAPAMASIGLRHVVPQHLGLLVLDEPFILSALVFPPVELANVSRRISALMTVLANGESRPLDYYGILVGVPPRLAPRKNADLVCHSFQHHPGLFYRFRYRRSFLPRLSVGLREFLEQVPINCPHPMFLASDNVRASAQDRAHRAEIVHHRDHDVIRLARASADYTPYKTRHENLERYFLESDESTVAAEVPLWSVRELAHFPSLTGHVDVLRWRDGRIEIWDYKPKAAEERTASLQVQLYCEMLAFRTGLPLTVFLAGYFDEADAYCFEPTSFEYL